ncbi:MAG: lipoyl(octanoyl) transferase LipB [Pseudomonadota bacterium]
MTSMAAAHQTNHQFDGTNPVFSFDRRSSYELISYPDAIAAMETRVAEIIGGRARDLVWALEHPPLYTAGTRAKPVDLLSPQRFPVYKTGRGGEYTYHGPGQRVYYVMVDLKRRGRDVRAFVAALEQAVINSLRHFGIEGETREGRVGVWVKRASRGRSAVSQGDDGEDKIAALGVRLRRWVSFHGVSVNLAPDLEHFSGIVPCGIREHGVTSFRALGVPVMPDVFDRVFLTELETSLGRLRSR